jgi:hypothetical protein
MAYEKSLLFDNTNSLKSIKGKFPSKNRGGSINLQISLSNVKEFNPNSDLHSQSSPGLSIKKSLYKQ